MLICGIDPGSASPGFTVINTATGNVLWSAAAPPPFAVDVAVVESGWAHGPMGKLQMWGLGFRACMQLMSVPLLDLAPLHSESARFKISPDCWRTALPNFRKGDAAKRLSKDVVVNLLRLRYGLPRAEDGGPSDDIVESRGITEGAMHVLARRLKKDRKGLVAV